MGEILLTSLVNFFLSYSWFEIIYVKFPCSAEIISQFIIYLIITIIFTSETSLPLWIFKHRFSCSIVSFWITTLKNLSNYSLRKFFKLKIIEHKSMDGFLVQMKCFQLIGFQRFASSKHQKLLKLLQIMFFIVEPYAMVSGIFYAVKNRRNVLLFAEFAGPQFTAIIALSKFITFYTSEQRFYDMMDHSKDLSSKSNSSSFLVKMFIYIYFQ